MGRRVHVRKERKMTYRRKMILLASALLSLAVIITSIIISLPRRDVKTYRQSIERAERYYAMGDYSNAALEYRKAINADRSEADGYEGLASTYVAISDYASARSILEEGYNRTGNMGLYSLLQALERGSFASGGEVVPVETGGSEKASINKVLLNRIGTAAYANYTAAGSPEIMEPQQDGSIRLRFPEVPGDMIFRNSEAQPDAVYRDTVSAGAYPAEIRLDDIAVLTGKAPVTRAELEGTLYSRTSLQEDPSYGYFLQFTAYGCIVRTECDTDGTVPAGARNSIVPERALTGRDDGDEMEVEGVLLQGGIIDAQTGRGIDGVDLYIRAYGDHSGEILAECEASDGEYAIDVPAGDYTVEISGDGYITDYFDITVSDNDFETEQNFVLSRDLEEGEIRIVLEWGAIPTDLDSHLTGVTDEGTECHVFFQSKQCSGSEGTVAELDLDDTDSYGPETTTIYQTSGNYQFSVHNYRPETGNLQESDATVTVYLPGGSPVRYDIGSDGDIDGDWWHVFTLDHGVLES